MLIQADVKCIQLQLKPHWKHLVRTVGTREFTRRRTYWCSCAYIRQSNVPPNAPTFQSVLAAHSDTVIRASTTNSTRPLQHLTGMPSTQFTPQCLLTTAMQGRNTRVKYMYQAVVRLSSGCRRLASDTTTQHSIFSLSFLDLVYIFPLRLTTLSQ